jgi:hypothetical protein
MSQSQQLADCYQALFNHLAQEYDLSLTESELDEVVKLSLATVQKIDALAGKPLFKQQIMDAYNQGYREGENDGSIGCVYNDDVAKHSDAAHYWQTTYGTNEPTCGCGNCPEHYQHKSDCAVHNMPAMANGQCDCNSTYQNKTNDKI